MTGLRVLKYSPYLHINTLKLKLKGSTLPSVSTESVQWTELLIRVMTQLEVYNKSYCCVFIIKHPQPWCV